MGKCLVTGGTKNDAAPMAALLLNLKDTQSWIDQVVLFHDGISVKDRELMQKIMPVEFIRYRFPGNRNTFNEIVRYVYTEMVFCKYECFRLLEKYDCVVWSDYDMLFLKDVPELVQDSGFGMKALFYTPRDSAGTFADQFRGDGWKQLAKHCNSRAASVCTGLFALSRNLKTAAQIYRRCIQLTGQYGEYLVFPEQAVLNVVFQEEHIQPENLSWNYSFNPRNGSTPSPDIRCLHIAGQPKFWNGFNNETWRQNYNRWLTMGGTPWKPEVLWSWRNLKKRLSFLLRRHFRNGNG